MADETYGASTSARQGRYPVEELRKEVQYKPDEGRFYLIRATPRRPVGTNIGSIHAGSGYLVVRALGANHLGQRAAYAMMVGEWPPGLMDFANGIKSDCRWSNLKLTPSPVKRRLTRDELMAAIDYDPLTGSFTWKARADVATNWNTRWAGKPACGADKDGYAVLSICGFCYKAHRLAILFMTGEWPPEDVDHADLDPTNNRYANLRLASRTDNNGNRAMKGRAASGLKGAYLVPATGRWSSRIQRGDVSESLGTFDTKEEAHEAYVRAAERLFGEFARRG